MAEERWITVVIPVYNVEQYLERCIQSVLDQTYKGYKVILIDDGSTDRSGTICDYYANEHDNFLVLHRKNGGLSEARNCSYQFLDTKYVTFIDSDDYIDDYYLERMISVFRATKADVVIMGDMPFYEGKEHNSKFNSSNSIYEFDAEEALRKMLYGDGINPCACGKGFDSELVKRHLFPKGKIYEDLATTYKMLGDAQKIEVIDCYPYHYLQRRGSIRHSAWSDSCFDVIEAAKAIITYVQEKYPNCLRAAINRYFLSMNELYIRAFREEKYMEIVDGIRKESRSFLRCVVTDKRVAIKRKLQFIVMCFAPRVYRYIHLNLKGKKH